MTILNQYKNRDCSALTELLIKNLPAKIKAGTEKHNANITTYNTVVALKYCPFINFNSQSRVSMMIFDIDTFNGKTAKKHFKSIDGLLEFITSKVSFEPTYILETTKGYHFAYALKNHVFLHQAKAKSYLIAVKKALTEILCCDTYASHRLCGVWRNPILHKHYFSGEFNYELSDFKEFLPNKLKGKRRSQKGFDVDKIIFKKGNRNNMLFTCGLHFAKEHLDLLENDVKNYLLRINEKKGVGLDNIEIKAIAHSVYGYWERGEINFKKEVNEGAMGLAPISNLTEDEFKVEVRKRQALSAKRTNSLRDKTKNKKALKKANNIRIEKSRHNIELKIKQSIQELKSQKVKISYSSIARYSNLDRRTVSKYIDKTSIS